VSELKGQINTLDAKVDGLSTRIGNQEFLLRTIVSGQILIILGGAAKMFGSFSAASLSNISILIILWDLQYIEDILIKPVECIGIGNRG
jgi:hypothetical protein